MFEQHFFGNFWNNLNKFNCFLSSGWWWFNWVCSCNAHLLEWQHFIKMTQLKIWTRNDRQVFLLTYLAITRSLSFFIKWHSLKWLPKEMLFLEWPLQNDFYGAISLAMSIHRMTSLKMTFYDWIFLE